MSNRFSAFVSGGLIGVAIGLLYAPRTGRETRDDLRKRADELMEQGMGNYEGQRERILGAVDAGRETALERTEELKAKIAGTRDKLKAQVDAAAESAKEKIAAAGGKMTELKEVLSDEPQGDAQE